MDDVPGILAKKIGEDCCRKVKPENAARMFRHPAPVLLNGTVVRMLDRREPRSILEVGAGCLRNALHLVNMGHRMTVLEVEGMQQRFPDQYAKFKRLGGKLLKTISGAPRFDVVICTFVIETICKPRERLALLRHIAEHLKPRGVLILSARGPRDLLTAQNKGVPCSDGYLTPNYSFARSFTKAQMGQLLRNAGFRRLQFLHRNSSTEPEYLHVIAATNE